MHLRSVALAKPSQALQSAWEGFANATDLNKIQSFINKSKRNKYCSPDLPDFNKVDLFIRVLKIPIHVLLYYIHYYQPPSVIHSDMVYDPEHATGLYQRQPQTLWIVTSSSECYISTHTD